MYLDNLMNKKAQKMFYGSIMIVLVFILTTGILFWVANFLANTTVFSRWFNQEMMGNGMALPITLTIGSFLGLLMGAWVLYTFRSNNLKVKRTSNNVQIGLIIIAIVVVGYTVYTLVHSFETYKYHHTNLLVRKGIEQNILGEGKANPALMKDAVRVKQASDFLEGIHLRYIASYVGMFGTGLVAMPITIYIRSSGSFWRQG